MSNAACQLQQEEEESEKHETSAPCDIVAEDITAIRQNLVKAQVVGDYIYIKKHEPACFTSQF